jgi:hypothetical protein
VQFTIPVASGGARSASLLSCSGPSTCLSPYRNVKDISVEGGWNTARVLRQDVRIGVRAKVRFTVETTTWPVPP